MLEQPLAYLLKNLLGEFVEDSEKLQEKLQIGVFAGLIILENLQLKNIFDALDLPFSLSFGSIGRLEIKIPWTTLSSDPVLIKIDQINVLIEPKYQCNVGASYRREQILKQTKLAAAEIFNSNSVNKKDNYFQSYTDIASKWLLKSFLNKIIDNIQVSITELHVRYEDHLSCSTDFCVGFFFELLHVQSREILSSNNETEKNKNSTKKISKFQKKLNNSNDSNTFHKLIQLNNFAVYWNPLIKTKTYNLNICCTSFSNRSSDEIKTFFSKTAVTKNNKFGDSPRHHYLLSPMELNVFLDLNIDTDTVISKVFFFSLFFLFAIIIIYYYFHYYYYYYYYYY
jgi:vacuolar protein sorting-associated protein 13A/C